MNWILCLAPLLPSALQEAVEAAPTPPGKGVVLRSDRAEPGYTLLAPLRSTETLLIDEGGSVVHRWNSEFTPGNAAELLPDGDLLRAAKVGGNERFHGGGEGGLLEQFTWEGERVWTYDLSTEEHLHHHDFEVLPNGNVLVLVWEGKSEAEARAVGRRPNSIGETGLWPDAIWELKPVQPDNAEIVWAWHAWDHLVQDHDENFPHYGDPAAHPERIDINIGAAELETPETDEEERARLEQEAGLRALGYLGDDKDEHEDEDDADQTDGRERGGADWMHTNAVDYDADLDLIVISVRNFSEVFVIDHSTTTEQAASSKGGSHDRGGDLLWRWGNAANYGQTRERALFGQHDARWMRDGEHVALSVFNNGDGRPDGNYSSVDLIHVPLGSNARFANPERAPALPEQAAWSYSAPEKSDFFSSHISGAMPISEGRFLVCDGDDGRVFQVDRAGEVLWDFRSPFQGEAGREGPPRGRRGPGRGEGPPPEGAPPGRGPGGGPGAGPDDRPEGRPEDGRGRGPDGGPGRGRGRRGGPGSATAMFRAVHIPLDHPGVAGRVKPASSD